MKDIAEVWTAYRELVSNPDRPAEEREAFWAGVSGFLPADAVKGLRRAFEFFLMDEPNELPPDPAEGSLELIAVWRRPDEPPEP